MSGLLTNPAFLALMIPIVAIVVWGLVSIIGMLIKHQERMAMIQRGMHPDKDDDHEDYA